MKRIVLLLTAILFTSATSFAASCQDALFDPAGGVFAHEGGYQNSKKDGGNWSSGKVGKGHMCGGTKYGIACAYNPGVDVRNLTKDGAARIYERNQCAELNFPALKGQKLPNLMLDMAVNMGTGTAIKLVEKTVNMLNGIEGDIPLRSELSPPFIEWINAYTADKTQRSLFYSMLIRVAIDRYTDIVQSNPKQAQWLLGWIIRVNQGV
jgi:hypothetical protein